MTLEAQTTHREFLPIPSVASGEPQPVMGTPKPFDYQEQLTPVPASTGNSGGIFSHLEKENSLAEKPNSLIINKTSSLQGNASDW